MEIKIFGIPLSNESKVFVPVMIDIDKDIVINIINN